MAMALTRALTFTLSIVETKAGASCDLFEGLLNRSLRRDGVGPNIRSAMAEQHSPILNQAQTDVPGANGRNGELRYRTLFDLVPVAVYATDAEGWIQEFNRRAVELWGRTPERNAEKYCGSFQMFHPDGRLMSHEDCPMAKVLRG